ncbi:hypothetical protein CONPUDRAFT_45562 [Coniophora puteana RWD-64-598 SS2]|uniref:Spc7 kinetochore protein domain-containing protein n=1 Tax=Coniophora puteana (strain RWD-64-598) TaxID=741705 RepID=A0A5M3N4Z0_CONPW|nr:uncharacterized protein CONPUDRAFT_45562 [Coniophora puteana RWD-64-598 SS2]EIW86479.1 hypothetical protein CONPUDRAFT_45562 [Coniophora puteana RWD-64-598 SS2]
MELTGIRFMDEITAPRRSTIHPSAHRPPRRSSTEMEIPLAEYVVAMAIDVPQLELYTHVSRDLQTTIERIKTIYTEAEAEAAKMTPELFMEFLNADEDGQAELLHQLKLIKVHNHGQAKSGWYDWKLKWVEQLFQKADEGFTHLEADARTLEEFTRDAQQIVPGLREEYEQIMRELEQDQADIAELENCDQDYLNELKTTINEQTASLELFRGDVEESKSKLAHLQSRMDDINAQKQEQTTAIQDAEYQLNKQKNNTRAEVLRLQDELTALQTLHTWKASKIAPDMFEFIYASTYRVSVPCVKFRPLVNDVEIIRLDEAKTKYKDPFPALSPLSLDTARRLVHTLDKDVGVRQIVELLGDYWTSCAQIRSQLRQVAIKYPVTIDAPPSGAPSETSPVFTATATLMFPSVRGKATVSFIFNTRTVQSWPMSIASLGCDVKVCYGAMDRHTLHNAILGRLGQATPSDNYACLLDACMDAMDCYV